tara:strand:- start:98 stop:373 length:276 start_codon:yes stop_codon:yes gene_type:complete
VGIILLEKKSLVFMVGFQGEAENKRKAEKLKAVGLLVEPVMIKVGQNLVVGLMPLKEEKEDVGQLVPHVKLTKGGKAHELDDCFKTNCLSW